MQLSEIGVIAVIGGTGAEGSGLAWRWANAGLDVIIGSRSAGRGAEKAEELNQRLGKPALRGTDNLSAAEQADVVVLSVPYESQAMILDSILPALPGKKLITIVAPLLGEKKGRYQPAPGGSAAVEAQNQAGENVTVVAAFQNVGAHHLVDIDHEIDCDVLVCGDDKAARDVAVALVQAAGMNGVHAGALQNAAVAEGLTALLISVNAIYRIKDAGIRITGLPA
ncbi:MAG: NADPH-dependent F420 reductase [Caldilineales bacterium]|nr:NADPH-dependent F420 reductase [Caldilineales bacterium]